MTAPEPIHADHPMAAASEFPGRGETHHAEPHDDDISRGGGSVQGQLISIIFSRTA